MHTAGKVIVVVSPADMNYLEDAIRVLFAFRMEVLLVRILTKDVA